MSLEAVEKVKDLPIFLGAVGTWGSALAGWFTITNVVGVVTLIYTLLRIFDWCEKRWKAHCEKKSTRSQQHSSPA